MGPPLSSPGQIVLPGRAGTSGKSPGRRFSSAQKGVELARIREAEADGRTLTPKEAREDAEPTLVYPKKRVPSLLDVVSESAGASFVRGAGRGLTESTAEAVPSLSAPVRVQ